MKLIEKSYHIMESADDFLLKFYVLPNKDSKKTVKLIDLVEDIWADDIKEDKELVGNEWILEYFIEEIVNGDFIYYMSLVCDYIVTTQEGYKNCVYIIDYTIEGNFSIIFYKVIANNETNLDIFYQSIKEQLYKEEK